MSTHLILRHSIRIIAKTFFMIIGGYLLNDLAIEFLNARNTFLNIGGGFLYAGLLILFLVYCLSIYSQFRRD